MPTTYNIYCDESCHLENDHHQVMVLGAIWCPTEVSRRIAKDIRDIKHRHRLARTFETKWTKVSPGKVAFYLDLVDYFFLDKELFFRALVVPDKSKLRHMDFQQTHDEWYYKMYFALLKTILEPTAKYRIYLDIKDTQSRTKIAKLHEVLCNTLYDFDRGIIQRIQPVHSKEVEQVQLADLLIGALGYLNRGQLTSQAKTKVVERIMQRSGYSLQRNTLVTERKCNLLFWRAQEETNE